MIYFRLAADAEDVILCPEECLYVLCDESEVCPVVALLQPELNRPQRFDEIQPETDVLNVFLFAHVREV